MADVPIDDLPPKYKKPLRRKRARVNDTNDGSPHALTPTPADEASGQPKSDDKTLANYTYGPQRTFVGAILVISDLLVFSFLGALVFASPDQMSGAAAVLKNAQGEYVGVLSESASASQGSVSAECREMRGRGLRPLDGRWGHSGLERLERILSSRHIPHARACRPLGSVACDIRPSVYGLPDIHQDAR